jgi:anti-sigma regulatory factor (Ser/Thr protein kinase)
MLENLKTFIQNIDFTVHKWLPIILMVFFILSPLINYTFLFIIFAHVPTINEIIVSASISVFLIFAALIIFKLFIKHINDKVDIIYNEMNFYDLIIKNTNEIFVLLNNFGEIVKFNTALMNSLNLEKKAIIGEPFRNLFALIDTTNNYNFKMLILEKLKEAFQGKMTEIISPIKIGNEDYQSIYFKLTPIVKNNELKYIFAIGRILKNDFIANNWLHRENSEYIISNDLTLSNILCYRLTRNLDGRLTRNEILFIQIALQEVIINAIEHGNLEISFEKKTELKKRSENYFELLIRESNKDYMEKRKVRISYDLEKDKVAYVISDEGKGFNWAPYLSDEPMESYTENLMVNFHGIGLQMVKSAFDLIRYNEAGNEITLIKYIKKIPVIP